MYKLNVCKALIALVMTAAVAACGGGGGGGSSAVAPVTAPVTSGVPASALASVDGLIAFMTQLIDTATNDTSEPIVLGDITLPVNETT